MNVAENSLFFVGLTISETSRLRKVLLLEK